VSETAPTDETVKPAPPVDPELPSDEELEELTGPTINFKDFKDQQDDSKPQVVIPDDLKDKVRVSIVSSFEADPDEMQLEIDIEEMEDDEPVEGLGHDEL